MTANVRNIGIEVAAPEGECSDPNCPFHGTLSVRGQIIDGVVETVKMNKTVIVKRDYLQFVKKYETRSTAHQESDWLLSAPHLLPSVAN